MGPGPRCSLAYLRFFRSFLLALQMQREVPPMGTWLGGLSAQRHVPETDERERLWPAVASLAVSARAVS